jgi:hypothetical protein
MATSTVVRGWLPTAGFDPKVKNANRDNENTPASSKLVMGLQSKRTI